MTATMRQALERQQARVVLAVLDVNAVVVFRHLVPSALQDYGVEQQTAVQPQPVKDLLKRHPWYFDIGRAVIGRRHVVALDGAANQVVEQRRPLGGKWGEPEQRSFPGGSGLRCVLPGFLATSPSAGRSARNLPLLR